MHKVVAITDLYPVIMETLRSGGSVSLMASGKSMMPMLHHQRDSIILEPVNTPLHLNDVVLYRRLNGQFVLHRIVGLEPCGEYILCGDSQIDLEHGIAHRQVIGRLQAFTHNGRHISCTSSGYRFYVSMLPAMRQLRHGLYIGKKVMSTIKRRVCSLVKGNR